MGRIKLFVDRLPPREELLELPPEAIGMIVLQHLSESIPEDWNDNQVDTLFSYTRFHDYASPEQFDEVQKRLVEGWQWLESERIIAHYPERPRVFITRRGKDLSESEDLLGFMNATLLSPASLDSVLAWKSRPLFASSRFDEAVRTAFIEVEIRVRNAAKLPMTLVGQDLMAKAFNEYDGPLRDETLPPAERLGMKFLFMGASLFIRNPLSHREVGLSDPHEASELIFFANHLLRIVGQRTRVART